MCTEDPYTVALPFFVMEFKGPQGVNCVGRAQAAYDAACIIYGHNQVTKHQAKDINNDKKAHMFSVTTDGHTFTVYAHFSVLGADGKVTYHQKPLVYASPTLDYESFKDARAIIRNLQDLARKKAEDLRDTLKHAAVVPVSSPDASSPLTPSNSSLKRLHPVSSNESTPSKRTRFS